MTGTTDFRLTTTPGFTLIELLIGMAIMLTVTGVVFQLVAGGERAFATEPEKSDMQQRMRVAADSIYRDLVMAGAGPYQGATAGPLINYLPPVVPARMGISRPDPALTFNTDRISILYVPDTRAQTFLATNMPSPGADLSVKADEAGCPSTTGTCGLTAGVRALIVETTAVGSGYDLFTVTNAFGSFVQHGSPNTGFSRAYRADTSRVAVVEQHVYYRDAAANQLMHYDGYQSDVPVVDNLTALSFAYYADPDPMTAPQPPSGADNCVFDVGPVPKLANLGGSALRELTTGDLTDGPICGIAPYQFDGDLLRVRKIKVTLRVRASDATGGAVARSGDRAIADYGLVFEVTPRNMNVR